jgi:hypothetical protein
MLADDPRDRAERAKLAFTARAYDEIAGSGMATLRELHNVPVSDPRRLLGMGRNTGAHAPLGVS